jgi:hypothetical protein
VASEKPQTLVDQAANEGLQAVEDFLLSNAIEKVRILVTISVEKDELPDGVKNGTLAGHGFEDGTDLLACLMGHAEGVAREMGLSLHYLPVERGEG